MVLTASPAALRVPMLPGPKQPPDGKGQPFGGFARGGAVGMDEAVGGRRPPETQQPSGTIQALPFHDRVRVEPMAHVMQPRVRHGTGLHPVGGCSHTAATRTGLPADSSRWSHAKAQSEQVAQYFTTAVCVVRLQASEFVDLACNVGVPHRAYAQMAVRRQNESVQAVGGRTLRRTPESPFLRNA